jgi:TRAP-type C4-dicarboxylate transport system permease small subunit
VSSVLSVTWQLIRPLGTLERGLCVALMGWIVVSIMIQVVTRYLLGQPLVWVEESAGYAFLWLVFLGAAAGFKELRHIRIETFVGRLPHRPRHFIRGALYALCTFSMLLIAWYAWGLMDVEARSSTIALPIELPRHLFYSVPLFVCTCSIAITGLYLVAAYWSCALSGRPIEAEAEVEERRRLDEALLGH